MGEEYPYPSRSQMAKVELEGEFCELRAKGSKKLNRHGYKDFVKNDERL